jgi:hypothetical protein
LLLSSNDCAAVLRQSKCAGDTHASTPAAKGLLMFGRFKVKMIGESETDEVQCSAEWTQRLQLYGLVEVL